MEFRRFDSKAKIYIIFVIFLKGAAAAPKRPAKIFKTLILAFEVKCATTTCMRIFYGTIFLQLLCVPHIVQNKTPNQFLPGEVPLR